MARAQSVDSTLWSLARGDRVFAIERVGDTIYIGGHFTMIGPSTGSGVPIDARTAAPIARFPKVAGRIDAVVPDGSGGWYIGGIVGGVDGQTRSNLAHITAEGTLDPWAPVVNGQVYALALDGDVLYVGGAFTMISGIERWRIAAFRTSDGVLLPWNPVADHVVWSILPGDSVIYAGGLFTSIGGQSRTYLAALDTASGRATPWNPSPNYDVLALAQHDTTLFIGGYFTGVGGATRQHIAAVSTTNGQVRPWDAGLSGVTAFVPRVERMLVRDSTLFVAGSFKRIGGADRQGLAALHVRTAEATPWDPRAWRAHQAGAMVTAIAAMGDTLFVSGRMDSLGGAPGGYLAALSLETGERFDWHPGPNREPFSLATHGSTVYAGGAFTFMGAWVSRRHLAAIDATTGRVTDWAPEPDHFVWDLAARGNTIFAGGSFSFIGGKPRASVAALDAATGQATAWNPGVGGTVYSLAPWGSTLLVGGWFGSAGGQPRSNLAAIDTATGLATSWNPAANDIVYAVAPAESVIYVGGWFSGVGGLPRSTLAALDPVTGAPTPWAPATYGIVRALLPFDGRIYVGGTFQSAGGAQRRNLACLDPSGAPLSWAPEANDEVLALAARDSTIYAGGFFQEVSGHARNRLAALDAATGRVREWDPRAESIVWTVAADQQGIYAGGVFDHMGNWPLAGFAAFLPERTPAPPPAPPGALALDQSAPNPARGSAAVRYALPAPARVHLTVFDLQGRPVARPIAGEVRPAGTHQVSFSTLHLRPGCYVYRLDADGRSVTRKMLVLK